ncbi:hypothetical protein L6452_34973 [Arctium lappa]|uniref:Uncharacterized protein n=1 Tax=Arctium lappa TaxID=4217 RepID=A0ACB8YJQ9_ARCLA|nr:hypothetical protein L6452_34973 [Arctium lappa]
MVVEAQLVSELVSYSHGSATSNSSGGDSRAENNVVGSVSKSAEMDTTGTDTVNPKVTRESVFKRLTYSNVVGGEKAGNLDFFPWRTRYLVWSRSQLSLLRR